MDDYAAATYGEGYADVYDNWYPLPEDTEATVARLVGLAGTRPVLELGVGTGRVAIPLAAEGVEVWGVDASAAMLKQLRAKAGGTAVHAVQTDMETIALPADAPRFSLAFAAFNTFFLMPTEQAQLACLQRVAELLEPDGHLVLDLFIPVAAVSPRGVVEVTSLDLDRLVLFAFRRWPTAETFEGHHVEISERGVRLRPWRMRVLAPAGVDAIAARAGFRRVERLGGWRGQPFTDTGRGHVSVYALI